MAVKSKVKPKSKSKPKAKAKRTVKSKTAAKAKPVKKATSKARVKAKVVKKPVKKITSKTSTRSKINKKTKAKTAAKSKPRSSAAVAVKPTAGNITEARLAKVTATTVVKPAPPVIKRTAVPLVERRRPIKRSLRVSQFSFMKAPGLEHAFDVGDTVEVYCDHEKSRERVRGWIKGIVVQVDNKLVAVQFRSNVYLTDGWMVPDRILWYPLGSEHIRPVPGKKAAVKKDFIPEY